jgi:hypothetical protein
MSGSIFTASGRLRPFWCAAIFFVAANWLLQPLLDLLDPAFERLFHPTPGFSAGGLAWSELKNLGIALVCTGIFALYERRRIDSYGLPLKRALGARTREGAAAGLIMGCSPES